MKTKVLLIATVSILAMGAGLYINHEPKCLLMKLIKSAKTETGIFAKK